MAEGDGDFNIVGTMTVNEGNMLVSLKSVGEGILNVKTLIETGMNPSLDKMIGLLSSPQLLAVVAIVAAITAAFSFAKIGVDAFMTALGSASEAEQINIRLESIIANTQKVGGVTIEMADQVASAMEKLSGVDEEVVKSSEALLLTFPNISKTVFPQAEQAALDLSAALGKDLTGTTMALGRALESPTQGMMALRREGIMLEPAIQNMIKSFAEHGRIAAADALILSEVEKRVGGVAAAMGSTFQGEMNRINNLFDDLGRDIGAIFLPVVSALVGSFRVIAEQVIGALAPALASLKTAFGELAKAMTTPEMKAAMTAFGKDLGKQIAELVEAFVKQGIPTIKQWADTWKKHGPEIIDTINRIVDASFAVADAIMTISDAVSKISSDLAPFIELGKDIVQGIIGGITANPDMVGDALKKIIDLAIASIKQQLGIASASKVLHAQVGQWIPAGIAGGIVDNANLVKSAMSVVNQTVVANVRMGGAAPAVGGGTNYHLYNPVFQVSEQDTMDSLMYRMNVSARGA